MLRLHLLATQAMRHIVCNISPHVTTLEVLPQIMVHLCCARMNRVFGIMDLMKNQLYRVSNPRNTNVAIKPQNTISI